MALHFAEATDVYRKTMPFVLLRIAIGAGLGLAAILFFGVAGYAVLTLHDAGTISGPIVAVAILIAALVFWGAWKLFVKYVLYMVKAGHIAVIAHVVETGEVPEDQIQFGKDRVQEYFVESSALFAIDKLVKAVVKELNEAVVSVSGLFSAAPALQQMIQILGKAAALAANFIDEAILAYLFVDDEGNKWRSARDGVVLYGKNWKPVLGSTILIVVGAYAVAFVALVALSPLASVLGGLAPTYELLGWVAVAGIALTIYAGVLQPWVKTVVITTFLIEARDDTPDSETVDWIEERSDRFAELMERAEEAPEAEAQPPEATA